MVVYEIRSVSYAVAVIVCAVVITPVVSHGAVIPNICHRRDHGVGCVCVKDCLVMKIPSVIDEVVIVNEVFEVWCYKGTCPATIGYLIVF